MTPTAMIDDGKPIVLSSGETAYLRQALVTCAQLLSAAHRGGGPASVLLAELTRQLAGGRSPGGLQHDLALAIDYLDFAPTARSAR